MNITKCNKCKKDKPQNTWGFEKGAPWIGGSIRGQGLNLYFDLCDKCGTRLAQYTKRYFKLEKSEE
ncbi:hypothetical protein A3B21_01915 [Candidatus Uhrbacteria bacterium RIFCSPLOWO2_01_FULL_47_24]|uniref:Uncharacterized protein n=1 Tax=Candidatus Uhrbacteria bacterium RIFCSPLOWO2_01_FULL_47_24 TaxID=1802401 RepID=A0A1F7UPA7_9BACT|nr:MAG: hypothetical protein A2753_01665 [Candidatus Uhrbacteria bacterium RIFCSPHIGHO2_01_FULL_47_11]OGL67925.1 MAG: hypothetical protein A3D58_05110 [Candidatus Uhrbacteria bacterium RIFCSPHIGHO2_02_FULL_46_47]OGL75196.1 MAG: hypothetical protein A3F52_04100 [Candidatus Uhrbacteria bacterium RIFCSPHIGHO2_12_FULL_47_11]OGL80111.1 MAG: hypothetical protein A3B21_01915 [Candidatus Uhrbacteria bacterium RIFCSPLOWO2_01_FULL_47_24]OGL84897.1 MAG: hypothetical protein A3J03_04300 [Candidatus Uhrbact